MEELEGWARHNEKEGEATDAGRSDWVTLPDTKGQTLDRGCPSCAMRSDFFPVWLSDDIFPALNQGSEIDHFVLATFLVVGFGLLLPRPCL